MTNGVAISLPELIALRANSQSLDLSSHKTVGTQLIGGHLSTRRGRGIDFDEVRIYQAGDDIRTIDWRVTARTGEAHTKLYREEKERPVFLVVDYSNSMFFGTRVAFKSVIAAQLAALIGWAAVKRGDRVGGVIFSGEQHYEFRPKSRQRGLLPFLKKLADLSVERPEKTSNNLAISLQHLRQVAKPGSLIFLISDFTGLNAQAEQHLNRLAQHNEIVANFIYDPLEATPPPPNRYAVSDGEQITTMDTASRKFCREYSQQFNQRYDYLQSICHKRRITLINFATNQAVIKTLRQGLAEKR